LEECGRGSPDPGRGKKGIRESEVTADNRRAMLTNPDDNSVSVVDIVAGRQLTVFKRQKT
jgi:hypothetical protein